MLLAAAVTLACASGGAQVASLPQQPLAGDELAAELRKGGYVLYLRHTATDFGQNDAQMRSFDDCATQRNLTGQGRADARRIGAEVRRLGIPVGRVLASPYCRTVETATLAFGTAEKTQEVRGGPAMPDDPKRYDALRRLLASRPSPGTNTVIASHGNPFHAVAGPPYLREGEIAVVRPGDARFSVIARITLEDWGRLPAAAAPAPRGGASPSSNRPAPSRRRRRTRRAGAASACPSGGLRASGPRRSGAAA